MRHGFFRNCTRSDLWRLLSGGLVTGLVLISLVSCKKREPHPCEPACAHATTVVLDMIAAQGTLNSKALTDRSDEMQRSCQAECREGGLDPECLLAAVHYAGLQECSAEAPSTPLKTQGTGSPPPK